MYIVSNMCQRELILADMLKKPIVPVMFDSTPWPPLGPASLILTQLAYVDLKGRKIFILNFIDTDDIDLSRCWWTWW